MSKDNKEKGQTQKEEILDELLGRFSSEAFGLQKREVSVMTRMSAETVEILDALVELEIFKSRSEAVAAMVEKVIDSRRPMFEEIKRQAKEIVEKRESARHLAYQAMKSESD
ncbi:hypothetical protein EU524_01570 [Candidatus Thorarchaeota archaeon]|nr:MAG: hypothetical protein EU524_01570 [Candidatus Thorarchaeota archaeon]